MYLPSDLLGNVSRASRQILVILLSNCESTFLSTLYNFYHILFFPPSFIEAVMTAWTVDNSFEADSRISKKVAYLINVICHGHMGEEWQHVCYITLGAIEQ